MSDNTADLTENLLWRARQAGYIDWAEWFFAQKGWDFEELAARADAYAREFYVIELPRWRRIINYVASLIELWVAETVAAVNDNDIRAEGARACVFSNEGCSVVQACHRRLRLMNDVIQSPSPSCPRCICSETVQEFVGFLQQAKSRPVAVA